jgi:hypothetical protein
MTQVDESSLAAVLEREIARFVDAAARVAQCDLYRNRRTSPRFHRAVPIMYMRVDNGPANDECATLNNVSNDGLAFHCDRGLPTGAVLAVKLFWSDTEAFRVPAIVRHCEITQQGFHIGAEFATHHHEACHLIESVAGTWYG